jgi:hypothetical protein
MWRRTYLVLVLVRLWFACSPSYLHPDENFQGPEVIAGTSISFFFLKFGLVNGLRPSIRACDDGLLLDH